MPPDPPAEIEVVEVVGDAADGPDAGDGVLDATTARTLPARTPEELLRALPGLQVSAHGGRGKAFQFLYRGFDAEHGADLALRVDGVTLNEPSNVHGHGYADLAIVPRRGVLGAVLRPGVDRVEAGAFATAASVDLRVGLDEPGVAVRVIGGTDRGGGLGLSWRPSGAWPGTFVVADASAGLGVGDGRGWRAGSLAAGLEGDVGRGVSGRLTLLSASTDFESPGALRQDDLDAGRVRFWGAYPGAGGGRSERVLAIGRLTGGRRGWSWSTGVWGGLRGLTLTQNFTGALARPDTGDGTTQRERSRRVGADGWVAYAQRVGEATLAARAGASLDVVDLDQRVDGVRPDGAVWGALDAGALTQVAAEPWAAVSATWRWLSVDAGVRGAGWWQRGVPREEEATARWLGMVAPRGRVEVHPADAVSAFVGYGRGYRPPRATLGVLGALVRSDVVQGGVVARPGPVVITATGFYATLDDELRFDHASGMFVGAGPSRRVGAELSARAALDVGVVLDGAVTFADGRFTETREPVPYAPRWLGRLAVLAPEVALPLGALRVGLEGWVTGPRPLPLGFRSRASATANLDVAWRVRAWTVGLEVDDVVGARWRDGEFVYASAWDDAAVASELPALHVTAGRPPAARLWIERRW